MDSQISKAAGKIEIGKTISQIMDGFPKADLPPEFLTQIVSALYDKSVTSPDLQTMATGIRDHEKFAPASIAALVQYLPVRSAAEFETQDGVARSSEYLELMKSARLTRCEFIYLTEICRYGKPEIKAFCNGRKYNPSLQVPTTKPGPYSQVHAVFMRHGDGDLYKRAINLIRRADRYVYDGHRIEAGGPLPRGWKKGGNGDERLTDMLNAREELDGILTSDLFQSRQEG